LQSVQLPVGGGGGGGGLPQDGQSPPQSIPNSPSHGSNSSFKQ